MSDPISYLTIATTSLAAISVLSYTALRGWRGWLDLKQAELQHMRLENIPHSAGSRIEIADLKERIRKLEAIAAGVEL